MGGRPASMIAPRGGLVASGSGGILPRSRGFGFGGSPFVNPYLPHGIHPGFGFPCARHPFLCGPRFRSRFGYGYSAYAPVYGLDYGDYSGNDALVAQLQAELANQQSLNAALEEELERERSASEAESGAGRRAATRPAARATAPERPTPATILVFRDGRRLEVQNYAIVGNALFELEPNRTQKILLAELDIPASIRVNDDRGVEFNIPGQSPARP